MIPLINLLPESPVRCLVKNDEPDARISLKWFRGHAYKDDDEMEELKCLSLAVRSGKVKSVVGSGVSRRQLKRNVAKVTEI